MIVEGVKNIGAESTTERLLLPYICVAACSLLMYIRIYGLRRHTIIAYQCVCCVFAALHVRMLLNALSQLQYYDYVYLGALRTLSTLLQHTEER